MRSLPVLVPRAPALEDVVPYLSEAHSNRRYTNHGPLEFKLRRRFEDLFRSKAGSVALFASGTAALTACLVEFGLPSGSTCLVPSWTFVGTAASVVQAGLTPRFMDVDPVTWTPNIDALRELVKLTGAEAAIIVAPFGGPIDYQELVVLAEETGLRILVDAASALDAVQKLGTANASYPIPIMVSLHATKLASSLEGGLILWDNDQSIDRMIAWSNFGISGPGTINSIGTNAKLSEGHAAYGLASLDQWDKVCARMSTLADNYVHLLSDRALPIGFAPNISTGMVSSTFNIVVADYAIELGALLAQGGIETRRWWKDGIHRMAPYQTASTGSSLAVTETLAAAAIGIPFYFDLELVDQVNVVDALERGIAEIVRARSLTAHT